MRTTYIFMAVAFLIMIFLHFQTPYREGFEDAAKTITICKADWCGHCKKAAPEFKKLISASPITLKDGTKATVTILDADQDKDKMKQYNVRGFPSILVNDGSRMIDYPGERTYNGVIAFLNNM